MAFTGPFSPSKGNGAQLCRVLHCETWRQIRILKDCLFLACAPASPPGPQRFFRELRTVSQVCEFWWRATLWFLRKKERQPRPHHPLTVVGEPDFPDRVQGVLRCRSKYCAHQRMRNTELLSLARPAASRAPAQEAERCILEVVEALPRIRKDDKRANITETVVPLRDSHSKLVLSDKEGGFAVFDSGNYERRVQASMEGNFCRVSVKPAGLKRDAASLCEAVGLVRLAESVKKTKGLWLSLVFSSKTQKEGCPFRAIVSGRGTWQWLVGTFLHEHLNALPVKDPFLVRGPVEVSRFLELLCPAEVTVLSVGMKDL
ncbi:hypothetical protein HPB48_026492 [Haemaphysalis longicornis]|uniref:Uncharacterized protein n=1 Tax=Haemaphysalis longicornis TaxID=44386 RepID=A0A9J6HAW7_HAELO|nr:hypothetical protein HPB48_026492 [Haemaphysalis longicornis]